MRAMPANRNIRDKYRKIIQDLATEHKATDSSHIISQNATRIQCIGYADHHVVAAQYERPHYRYDRYRRALASEIHPHPVRGGTVIHVDIGCGPRLFSWVVRDFFRRRPNIDVKFHGYDHALNMARFAIYLWERFEEDADYLCFHNLSELLNSLEEGCAANSYVIVTFGHVLVQTVDSAPALAVFARIIAKCARLANCLMIAVDAQTGDRPKDFRRSLGSLKTFLENRGLTIEVPPVGATCAISSVCRTQWA